MLKNVSKALIATGLTMAPFAAMAAEGKLVPEVHFLSWPAAKYQVYAESSNYIAEQWRKLGLKVRVDQVAFPNPMLAMWFKEHKFDVVLSSLSGAPYRLEPDFFTYAQFNSKNAAPGNWNVGEFSNATVDKLGEQQLGMYVPEKRREVIHDLQKALHDNMPEIVLNYTVSSFAINSDNMSIDDYQHSPQGIRANQNILRMKTKSGKAVRIGWTVSYTTVNPLVASTIEDLDLVALMYDRLIWIAPNGSPEMMLAKSFEVVDDKTVDVQIRTDHTFSDGKPVTAEDVKFSFDYFKKWEAVYLKKYLSRLASVEIRGKDTVRFKLSQPYAPFIMNTLGQVYVLPKHIWSTLVKDKGLKKPQDFANTKPIGSGPYTLKYRKEGQEVYLSRRADHFAKPKSDILHIIFGSAEVIGQTLKKGSIDASFQPLVPTSISEFTSAKNIKIYDAKSNGYNSARFKVTGPVFWNLDLRRALSHAVPYQAIIDEIYGGNASKSASSITPVNAYWHNASLPEPKLDLDKAKAMLKDAGFTWDGDGRLHFPAE